MDHAQKRARKRGRQGGKAIWKPPANLRDLLVRVNGAGDLACALSSLL